jgi:hypothetical protein
MEAANDNLMSEAERKDRMIEKYELDIYSLKEKKSHQEQSLSLLMDGARDQEHSEMDQGIKEEAVRVQE